MDLHNIEIDAIESTPADSQQAKVHELHELQLALVGGGIGNCELG
jgi:hypothetical protein